MILSVAGTSGEIKKLLQVIGNSKEKNTEFIIEKSEIVNGTDRCGSCDSRSYKEKLRTMLNDDEAEPIEWSQSNEEVDNGYTETEVTFRFKTKTPVKE